MTFFAAGFTTRIFPYEASGHKYISCNSKAWQSEWGFIFQCVYVSETDEYVAHSMSSRSKPSRFFRRKGKARRELLGIKKTDEVEKTTGWREKSYS
jgi:hypothetical protein